MATAKFAPRARLQRDDFTDERSPHRLRRPRARAGLGAVARARSDQALLRARQRRNCRGGASACASRRRRPRRRHPLLRARTTSTSSSSDPRRRSSPASSTISTRPASRCSGLEGGGAARRLEGLHQGSLRASSRIPTAAYGRFTDARGRQGLSRRRRSCRSSSRPTAWPPARAWSSPRPRAEEAEAAVDACFSGAFGAAGAEVVIEEFLDGEEASFFALVRRQRRARRSPRRRTTSASATATPAPTPAAWAPTRPRPS